jgi:N-acetylmuramoyl-L-alanine amidase
MMKAVLILSTFLSGLPFSGLPNINGGPGPVASARKIIKAAPHGGGDYQIKTVVIDPGHGGHDPGCSGANSREKHLCLSISKYFAQALESNYPDLKVIMTRSTDKFIPLHERAAIATHNRADLFISIHCNFIPKASHVHGTETYVLGLHATEANLDVAKRENSSILYEENYQETYGYDPNSAEAHIMLSMFQNAFLEQSILFAEKVQFHAETEASRKDKGVKQAGFLVLRHATMPSVLVETGYLSNGSEEKFLLTTKGQKQMANALLLAFHEYKMEMEGKSYESLATPKKLEIEETLEEIAETPPAESKTSPGVADKINEEVKVVTVKSESQPLASLPKEKKSTGSSAIASSKKENVGPSLPKKEERPDQAVKKDNPPLIIAQGEEKTNTRISPSKKENTPLPGKILPSKPVETNASGTSTGKPESIEVQYRVQLAASPELLDVTSGKWAKIEFLIEVVTEGNLYKYQVRNFASLEEADLAKQKLRAAGFNDAFVVAYQNGKRVDPKKLKG